jgi:hypothetical protein
LAIKACSSSFFIMWWLGQLLVIWPTCLQWYHVKLSSLAVLAVDAVPPCI